MSDRSANPSGQMRAAFAPVKTRPAERPPAAGGPGEINAETGQELRSLSSYLAGVNIEHEISATDQAVGQCHAKLAGEVVVTGSRPPHLGVDLRRRPVSADLSRRPS
jgi:hypothetical protein